MQQNDYRSAIVRDRDREERHRSRDREHDRDRDRERERMRDRSRDRQKYHDRTREYRRDEYRSDRHRDDKRRDRHRDHRFDRERSHKSSRRDSRSRSRDSRRRRSKSRYREGSHERRHHTKDRDRSKRDLSVEIEQELQHLRKLSDLKQAAAAKMEKSNHSESESESKPVSAENSNSNSSQQRKMESDFHKMFNNSNSKTDYVPEIQTEEERIEFQKKMQEKLQAHLAAEGKLYPRPKPSPAINSVTGFANDGSFLEMFKKMQEQSQTAYAGYQTMTDESTIAQTYPGYVPQVAQSVTTLHQQQQQLQQQPVPVSIVGRRRGGKILKTGIVKKQRPIEDSYVETPNDAWNLYLQEVQKYKNASCDADSKTRPLVK
ncbi:RNA-binding protein 25-like [Malaya genurostris]|uniref:RNA-binding protein 25-like n=1 Tax=Malaya genurostris TaxID=325434 RepID=UPI0026F3E2F8|nr:RNA-binding protein 25-like [Malaya genurostris]XP_058465944.1 RNA-binding protein 25-like [Malaya genurostris]XP_058465945.1 RNA-binding protein 25-like [Malaya genurostris]